MSHLMRTEPIVNASSFTDCSVLYMIDSAPILRLAFNTNQECEP